MATHFISRRAKGLFSAAFVILLVAGYAKLTAAQTSEPSREPILRIETRMHTGSIRSISVDGAGRFLVTASDDKTVRVWELTEGRLLRVLRVPISEGKEEGRLYAVAISPNSEVIAASGMTGYSWENLGSVYLFDRDSSKLVRRLSGLPSPIIHLAFSPDGDLLAATLGSNGVYLWRTTDWTEIGHDMGYGDIAPSADFDHMGRLVTSCFDGWVRLYDRNLLSLPITPSAV